MIFTLFLSTAVSFRKHNIQMNCGSSKASSFFLTQGLGAKDHFVIPKRQARGGAHEGTRRSVTRPGQYVSQPSVLASTGAAGPHPNPLFFLKWFYQKRLGFCLLPQGDKLPKQEENQYNYEGNKEKWSEETFSSFRYNHQFQ